MPLDQAAAPYLEALTRYAGVPRAAFHTPGHVQGRGSHPRLVETLGRAALAVDLCTGLEGLDGRAGSALAQAETLAAAAYGAERTWFLINGSTAGNQILLCALCHPGETVLVSRNTHKSIVSALIVSGARPAYIEPELDSESHMAHGVTPERVAQGLAGHPEARAVLVVSPTYHGVCSDLTGIAEVAHRHGVPLLVDEAWGPHLPFHPELPAPALAQGADASVTGAHKLIGALTQAAMLHARGPLVDLDRLDVVSRMLQSTSPSCLLYASLDAARMQMATCGRELLQKAIDLAREARKVLSDHPHLSCLDENLVGRPGVAAVDPTRLCVNVAATGHTGYEVARRLAADHDVVVEMADFAHVLANVTIGHDRPDIERLCAALLCIADALPDARLDPLGFEDRALLHSAEQVLSPGEAFHAPQHRVALNEAAGRVSAELVATYPPGIPVVVPGERLTDALVGYLAAQVAARCRIVGSADPLLGTLSVVVE